MSQTEHLRLVEAPAPPVDPLIGQTVDGRYLMEGVLGQGGMGVVYAAKHVVLGKRLAIKVLKADVSKDQEIIARFQQEAKSASAIGSQHIIDISDFGQLQDGSAYFVMEYLEGKELTKVIEREQPIAFERVVKVAKQLCDALGAAHEHNIVHRDMKPDNVFLVKRGKDHDFVKVLDFGIAKVGGANSKLTRAGQVFGTPHYMSPEQCSGQPVDHRTDIYAVGVILYEMACGRVPFDADNLMGILTKHIYEQPIPLHQLPPPHNVPAGLEAVILKCLAKQADHRYQTMADMKADLEAFEKGTTPNAVVEAVERRTQPLPDAAGRSTGGLSVAVGGASVEEPKKSGGMIGVIVGILALLILGGAAVGGYFVFFAQDPEPVVRAEPEPDPGPTPEELEAQRAAEQAEQERRLQEEAARLAALQQQQQQQGNTRPITVMSEPPGAEVWADGALVGNTPVEIPRPARGEAVELLLKAPGMQDHTVRLAYLTQAELRVTMRPAHRTSRPQQQQPAQQQQPPPQQQQQPPPQQQQQQPPRRPQQQGEVLDPWS